MFKSCACLLLLALAGCLLAAEARENLQQLL